MSSVAEKLSRLRHGSFRGETMDRIQAWIVFVGVPLMVVLVAILMLVVSQWVSDAKMREEARAERLNEAVERVIQEVRDPASEAGSTREETFDRVRQLCEVHEGCEP